MKSFKEYFKEEVSMKVLSIKQPWAWLIVNGYKDIENRKWKTNFRGKCLIHSGKQFDSDGYKFIKQNFKHINLPRKEDFEYGGIVGEVEIIDCVQRSNSPWFFGPFGFVIINAKKRDFVPLKGQLGFFNYGG